MCVVRPLAFAVLPCLPSSLFTGAFGVIVRLLFVYLKDEDPGGARGIYR